MIFFFIFLLYKLYFVSCILDCGLDSWFELIEARIIL
jgi:hypothetical protein